MFNSQVLNVFRTAKWIAFCSLALASVAVSAQEKGDRVVIAATSGTKYKAKEVGKVFEGSIYTITDVKDKWCMLGNVKGWLPIRNVMNLNDAIERYSKRLREKPKDGLAWVHRGMIYNDLGKYDLAFHDLNQSLSLNRTNPVVWMNRGIVLKAQGKYLLAAADFKEAIRLNPKLANAHFNIGLVFYAMNDFKQAVQAYDAAIKLVDRHPIWFVSRGGARLNLSDIEGARKDYQQALTLDPGMADAHVGLSNLALINKDYEEAYRQADKAVEIQPENAMALNARGWILFEQDKVEAAIKDLDTAIGMAPNLSIAYGNRGVCYVRLGEYDKALADHSEHIRRDPESPLAFSNRALAWLGKGDYAQAKEDFETAEKMSPNLDETLNGYAWFLATCPSADFRNGELALEKAKQACEISKHENWDHLDTLAAAHAELGQFKEAIQWTEKAIELCPESKRATSRKQLELLKKKQPIRSQPEKEVPADNK